MNITPLNNNFTDGALQSAYAKQTQGTSEIATSKHNNPQQANAVYGAPDESKSNMQDSLNSSYAQPSTELPAEVPINIPVSASLASALVNEINQFPDINHGKISEIRSLLDSGKLAGNSNELAGELMNFYQNWR